ncbi:MAG: mandelate racemase/muconate lactonizing enzyme family protein [Rhodospirillaceae bacterium]|jgi:D-galactarolactone cycloisomerase|nr:mandelate racemase/muconate lactonizing enzyme family protein [Rhodospirillaceae bacterium]
MRIADVQTHILNYDLDTRFQSSFSTFQARTHCLVEITCEDGTVGWGECLGPAVLNGAVVEQMRGWLIGKNPLETERLWLTLYHQFRDQGQRGVTITALSGIDIALWDIKGKHFGAPVHVLLGGAFRTQVKAYATGGFRRVGGERVSDMVRETAGYVAEGFEAMKIKIGYGAVEDIATIEAVRDAIGPDTHLMIDANHGYDALEAIQVGNAVADLGIDWFEEPVVPEDLDGYIEVKQRQPIPVAGGETWYTRWNMLDVLKSGAVDILQPDVCGVGGLSESVKIADMAAAFGVRLIPHVWGTGVAIAAGLQYLAVLPDVPPRHEPRQPWLEFDRTENPFRQAVLTTPIEHEAGVVAVPQGPGLGIEIDRAALEQYRL